MSVAVDTPPKAPPPQDSSRPLVLENVSWKTYVLLLRDLEEQHLRLTYDNGRLSLVSPSRLHERLKTLLGRLLETLALEQNIPILSFGSATWKRRALRKGLEGD